MNTKLVIDSELLALREECERAMHAIFAHLGIPKSYLDLDCRNGYMVRAARMFGCKPAVGQAHDFIVKRDAKRFAHLFLGQVVGQYDLITCMQEQLSYDVADNLVDGGHLVVGSAFPNGKGAVNGLHYDPDATKDLLATWTNVAGVLPKFVQVYVK